MALFYALKKTAHYAEKIEIIMETSKPSCPKTVEPTRQTMYHAARFHSVVGLQELGSCCR